MQSNQPGDMPIAAGNGTQPNVNSALMLPELLEIIFDYIQESEGGGWESPTLLECSLVCRTWRYNALRSLWKATSLYNLMSALGTVWFSKAEEQWEFEDPANLATEYFINCAKRVERLDFEEYPDAQGEEMEEDWNPERPPIFRKFFGIIHGIRNDLNANAQGPVDLLPNLASLTWFTPKRASAREVLSFLSPHLEDLSLHLVNDGAADSEEALIALIEDIQGMRDFQPWSLRLIIDSLPEGSPVSGKAMEWIRGLQRLGDLDLQDVDPRSPSGLRTLFNNAQLTGLSCQLEYDSYEPLHGLLGSLSEQCPNLETVTLKLFRAGMPRHSPLHFDSISSLLALHKLIYLCVDGDVPCVVSQNNIVAMGEAWPDLQVLSLCEDPQPGYSTRGTPMDCIKLFAKAFQGGLIRIDLLLDCNTRWGVSSDGEYFYEGLRLMVGSSLPPTTERSKTALVEMLAEVCPEPDGLELLTSNFEHSPLARRYLETWDEISEAIQAQVSNMMDTD